MKKKKKIKKGKKRKKKSELLSEEKMIKSEKMRCAIKILKYKATKNIYFKKRYEQYINDISV
jgi:transposase